jgi:hypothetical protein
MDERLVFEFIADEFKKAGIPFMLIGGFALKKYGSERFTSDIDLLIDKNQYAAAKIVLENGEYEEKVIGRVFARFSENRGESIGIDILFVEKPIFERLFQEGQRMEWADRQFTVPSPVHLIALKLHALKNGGVHRETKDLLDVVQVIRFNRLDIDTQAFRKLCLDYGPVGIFDKIKVLCRPA